MRIRLVIRWNIPYNKEAVRRVPLCMVVRHLHRMRGVLAPRIYRQFCFPYFYYTIISTKRQGFLPGFLWIFFIFWLFRTARDGAR